MRTQLVVLGVALAIVAGPVMADSTINGSKVNLVTLRDTVATSSPATQGTVGMVQYPAYSNEMRLSPGNYTTPAWYMVNFGDGTTYSVSNYQFFTFGSAANNSFYSSFTYRIEYLDSNTGTWKAATLGAEGADENGYITLSGTVPGYVSGSFAEAIDAQYVRLAVPAYTCTGTDYGVFLKWFHLTGHNAFDVNPNVSLTALGHVGTPMVTHLNSTNSTAMPHLIDDYARVSSGGQFQGNGIHVCYNDSSVFVPGQIIMPLDDVYALSAIGITTMGPDRDDAITQVGLWYSPDETGNNWIPLGDGPFSLNVNTTYQEINLGGVEAKRVRLDVLGIKSGNLTYIPQLHLYGSPVPEPAAMTLLALGGLAMLRRRTK